MKQQLEQSEWHVSLDRLGRLGKLQRGILDRLGRVDRTVARSGSEEAGRDAKAYDNALRKNIQNLQKHKEIIKDEIIKITIDGDKLYYQETNDPKAKFDCLIDSFNEVSRVKINPNPGKKRVSEDKHREVDISVELK